MDHCGSSPRGHHARFSGEGILDQRRLAGESTGRGAICLESSGDAKVLGASIDVAADGLISLYVNGKPTLQGSTSHTAPFHADFGHQLQPGRNILAIGSNAVRNARTGGGKMRSSPARRLNWKMEGTSMW